MAMRLCLLLLMPILISQSIHGVKTPYKFKDVLVLLAKSSNTLHYGDIQDLLLRLHFENCTKTARKTECNRCLSAKDLGFHTNTVVNSTEFVAKAPVIVYSLMPEKNAGHSSQSCDGIPSLPSKLFETLAYNFTHGKNKGITQHALEHILENVNLTLRDHLHKKRCFSAEQIFNEVKHILDTGSNKTALDEDEFQTASAIIVYRLLQGYCISKNGLHSSLPYPTFFLDDIFKKKTYLSEGDLEKFTSKLGIGKEAKPSSSHDGHNHRRRRRRAVDTTPNPTSMLHNATCYSLDSLMTVFDINHETGASKDSFKDLCPAFLQQYQSGVCSKAKQATASKDLDHAKIWGYGFLSVTLISLTSLCGVATIPFTAKSIYKKVLSLLVALGVGTLTGDALLHLIPHAFGLHAHGEGESHDHASSPFIWKALIVLFAIYLFYIFEVIMHFGFKRIHAHSHVDVENPVITSQHMSQRRKSSCSKFEHHSGVASNIEKPPQENEDMVFSNVNAKADSVNGQMAKKPSNFSSQKRQDDSSDKGILPVAWMIIFGDAIHNISDGLAIGAALSAGGSSGIAGGISTSIAVFCHELPHELGDFAVLLTAGMSVKKALLANFLSACSCYIGLVIGIQLSQELDIRLWIFAIAGGMFIYLALVDMLPNLMHNESLHTDALQTILFQNIGILLGFGIMLIISLYEEELMTAVKL